MAVLFDIEKKFGQQGKSEENPGSENPGSENRTEETPTTETPRSENPGSRNQENQNPQENQNLRNSRNSQNPVKSRAKFSEADFSAETERFVRRLNRIVSCARVANTVSEIRTHPESAASPLRPRGPTPAAPVAANVQEGEPPAIPKEFWESFDRTERKVWELRSRGEFLLMRTEIQRVEDWVENWMRDWRTVAAEKSPGPNVIARTETAGVVSADEIDLGI